MPPVALPLPSPRGPQPVLWTDPMEPPPPLQVGGSVRIVAGTGALLSGREPATVEGVGRAPRSNHSRILCVTPRLPFPNSVFLVHYLIT